MNFIRNLILRFLGLDEFAHLLAVDARRLEARIEALEPKGTRRKKDALTLPESLEAGCVRTYLLFRQLNPRLIDPPSTPKVKRGGQVPPKAPPQPAAQGGQTPPKRMPPPPTTTVGKTDEL
jgi:hypothetical protein